MQGVPWPDEETRRRKTAERMRVNRKRHYARHSRVPENVKRENYQRAARRRADLLWGPDGVWRKNAEQRRQARDLLRLKVAYVRAMRRIDSRIQARLARNLRSRFKMAMKVKGASRAIRVLVGCSMLELQQHLESQFRPGMAWENYGFRGWHIDHKTAVSKFDLRDPEQVRKCFHFSNLQPLWAVENLMKSDS